MEIKLDLYKADEMDAFALFLNACATAVRKRQESFKAALADGPGSITPVPGTLSEVEDKPKRTRGPNKKNTTVSDLPADVVAEAEAAGVHVEDESRIPDRDEKATESAEETTKEPEQDDKPLTEDQVRNLIIDYLNEVQAKSPDTPDARTTALKGLLEKLGGAAKISAIPMARYGEVPALIEAARAAAGGAE